MLALLVTFWTASQYVGKPTPKVLDYIIWLAYARYAAKAAINNLVGGRLRPLDFNYSLFTINY